MIKQEGVTIENFRLNKIKRAFFKSVLRKLIVIPEGLEISDPIPDEVYSHRFKITLSFFLPSGSYATVVLRRVQAEEGKN